MDVFLIIKIFDEKGEVSLDIWKVVFIKENDDGIVDIFYKNKYVGSDGDFVFLWIYVNIVEEDDDVCVFERIIFKKEDIFWLVRYVFLKVKVIRGLFNSLLVGGV